MDNASNWFESITKTNLQTYKLACHFYPNFGQSLGNSDNKDLLWRICEILWAVMVKLH